MSVAPSRTIAPRTLMIAALGGGTAIAFLALLSDLTNQPLVLGSFGASCVLLFGYSDSPFSRPRNLLGGHFLASLVGLVCLTAFGASWWSVALALGLAITLMLVTDTVHPPAGSNPVIVMLTAPGWDFLATPTLAGASGLLLVAWITHRVLARRDWPAVWI